MSRKAIKIKKRELKPDRKYGDVRIAKFINYVMRKGKKKLAQKIVYEALEKASKIAKQPPLMVFEKAIDNVSPLLEVRPMRIGGATYRVPYEVPPHRRFTLGAKWLIESALEEEGDSMINLLAKELVAAYNNEGAAVKKKLDMHKLAESNRAFAHYARY